MAIDLGLGDLDLNAFGPASTVTPPTSPLGDFDATISSIGNSVANLWNTKAAITNAQTQAQIAKAAGQNAVQVAQAGLPSVNILVLGGFALLAIVLLKKT